MGCGSKIIFKKKCRDQSEAVCAHHGHDVSMVTHGVKHICNLQQASEQKPFQNKALIFRRETLEFRGFSWTVDKSIVTK